MAKHSPPFGRVRHFPAYRPETRDERARQLNALYFGSKLCCCKGFINSDISLRDALRHTWHALRCRLGYCVWTPERKES